MIDVLEFHIAIGGTLGVAALLLGFLAWMFRQERFRKWHIRGPMKMRVTRKAYLTNIIGNGALSMAATTGMIYGFSPWTMTAEATPWWMIVGQGFLVLFVYDFAYYGLHRFMHVKKLFPLVHAVHHRSRFPSALDSLYQSPIELLSGLGLLIVVTAALGPIHWAAFTGVFFIYSTLHIVIHSGMIFPHKAFGLVNYLTMKHHRHHLNKHGHNYASVTPLPDFVFRTAI